MNVEYGFGYLAEDYFPHTHTAYELHFFTRGSGQFSTRTQNSPIHANHLFASFPETNHEIRVSDPLVFHFIQISNPGSEKALLDTLCQDSELHDGFILDEEFHYALEKIRILGNQQGMHAQEAARHSLLSLLHSIYIESHQNNLHGARDPVGQGIIYLRQHIREKVTLDQLADAVGFNKHYVSRLFTQRTGHPPIEYFLLMKLDAAAFLLQESLMPQKRIAEHLALGDEFYFSRLFKQKKGQTPRDYRKKSQAGRTYPQKSMD